MNKTVINMATSGDMSDIYKVKSINLKRQKFLGLSAEHQNLLRDGDRYLIHNASLVGAKRVRDFNKISFLPEKPIGIHAASYAGLEPLDKYTRNCIHAYALYSLYGSDWNEETNPTLATTLGSVITILASYVPYSALKESGLETNLAHCHLTVTHKVWNTIEEVKEGTKEIRETVADLMKLGGFYVTPQAYTIVALSVLILIGKNVTENNRAGWFKNRWKALANVANVSLDDDRIEPLLLRPCQALYISASANQPIRYCLFKVMRTLTGLVDDQTHIVFDRIIHLLQWAEMSHNWMIMEYVYDQNPDVFNFSELNGPEIAAISEAIEFLKKFLKKDRPYLKLLIDHNDFKSLHSINFIHFTAAAHAISSLTRSAC